MRNDPSPKVIFWSRADNDEFGLSEDDKQEIIYRHKLGSSWDYILEPIKDEKQRKTLIEFFEGDE